MFSYRYIPRLTHPTCGLSRADGCRIRRRKPSPEITKDVLAAFFACPCLLFAFSYRHILRLGSILFLVEFRTPQPQKMLSSRGMYHMKNNQGQTQSPVQRALKTARTGVGLDDGNPLEDHERRSPELGLYHTYPARHVMKNKIHYIQL